MTGFTGYTRFILENPVHPVRLCLLLWHPPTLRWQRREPGNRAPQDFLAVRPWGYRRRRDMMASAPADNITERRALRQKLRARERPCFRYQRAGVAPRNVTARLVTVKPVTVSSRPLCPAAALPLLSGAAARSPSPAPSARALSARCRRYATGGRPPSRCLPRSAARGRDRTTAA
jgi:hypothetical protein